MDSRSDIATPEPTGPEGLLAEVEFGSKHPTFGMRDFNQPERTYTITVTGTSGSLSRSAIVTLTVE